jgi:hypothetical protein
MMLAKYNIIMFKKLMTYKILKNLIKNIAKRKSITLERSLKISFNINKLFLYYLNLFLKNPL